MKLKQMHLDYIKESMGYDGVEVFMDGGDLVVKVRDTCVMRFDSLGWIETEADFRVLADAFVDKVADNMVPLDDD